MKEVSEDPNIQAATDGITSAGANGDSELPHAVEPPEVRQAKDLASRYRLPFVNLLPQDGESPIDYSLLNEIPVDLMLRNQFVPLRRENGRLHIAMADPTDLDRLDDLAAALRARLVPYVATAGAIDVVLRKGDATQRVLQEAASSFRISLVRETETGEEVLDLDRLATDSDMSPIIKLVDTIVFNAMESRASDIHIETRDTEVQVKYRIDGALYQKVDSDRSGLSPDFDFAHQGYVGTRHRRAARAAGRPLPRALQRAQCRFPRLDHADGARRGCGHSYSRQGTDQRIIQEPRPRCGRF
jgi:hypothetical protein